MYTVIYTNGHPELAYGGHPVSGHRVHEVCRMLQAHPSLERALSHQQELNLLAINALRKLASGGFSSDVRVAKEALDGMKAAQEKYNGEEAREYGKELIHRGIGSQLAEEEREVDPPKSGAD